MSGRKPIEWYFRTLTVEKMKAAYKRAGSLRGAERLLGISRETIRKYLRQAGVELRPRGQGQWKGKLVPEKHTGCLPEWLRRHPDVKLPRSVREIAFVTGCSVHAVRAYLYRRRKWEQEHKNAQQLIDESISRGEAEHPSEG